MSSEDKTYNDLFNIGIEIEFVYNDKVWNEDNLIRYINNCLNINLEPCDYTHEFNSTFFKKNLPSRWGFSYDYSVRPDKKLSEYYARGFELISPILSFEEFSHYLPKIFNMLKHENIEVSSSSGFHINISFKDRKTTKDLNKLKLILLSGDKHLYKLFSRTYKHQNLKITPNTYILKDILHDIKVQNYDQYMKIFKTNNVNSFSKNIEYLLNGISKNKSSLPLWYMKNQTINLSTLKLDYIEFRVPGGENYHKRYNEICNITKHFMDIMNFSTNDKHKQKFAKKLYKIVNDTNIKNDDRLINYRQNPPYSLEEYINEDKAKKFYLILDPYSLSLLYKVLSDLNFDKQEALIKLSRYCNIFSYTINEYNKNTFISTLVSILKEHNVFVDDVKPYFKTN